MDTSTTASVIASAVDEDEAKEDCFNADVATMERILKLSDLIKRGRKSDHYSWVDELKESLKITVTTPCNMTFGYRSESDLVGYRGAQSSESGCVGYRGEQSNSLHQLLALLRDALLHIRWV